MRSAWLAARGIDEQHAPVEMRFVDMFMTALGSLVFLALILAVMPKSMSEATPVPPPDMVPRVVVDAAMAEIKELNNTIAELNSTIAAMNSVQTQGTLTGELDKNTVKRWLGVLLATRGCTSQELELYARPEGKLIDFETRRAVDDALPFAMNPLRKTILAGA